MGDLTEVESGKPVYLVNDVAGIRNGYVADRLKVEADIAPGAEIRVKGIGADDSLLGKRFISSSGVLFAPNNETDAILIRNPSGSNVSMIIDRQFFVVLDSNTDIIFRVYATPAVTSVTTLANISNSLVSSGPASQGKVYITFATSSSGTLFNTYFLRNQMFIDEVAERIVLEEGNDLLVTTEPSGNNKRFAYNVAWIEESNL